MVTIVYERVEHQVTKTVSCRVCGRKLNRSTTFGQTLSPFNTNADGTRKTRDQIRAELKQQAADWHPTNDIHRRCIGWEKTPPAAA